MSATHTCKEAIWLQILCLVSMLLGWIVTVEMQSSLQRTQHFIRIQNTLCTIPFCGRNGGELEGVTGKCIYGE